MLEHWDYRFLNQYLFKVISDIYPKWFYYFWTESHLIEFQRVAAYKAITMGHIKRQHLTDAKGTVVKDELIKIVDAKNVFITYLTDQ